MFYLNKEDVINDHLIQRIASHGYSRFPIMDSKGCCVGILRTKKLVDISQLTNKSIENSGLKLDPPLMMLNKTNLLEAMSIMEQKRSGIALVIESPEPKLYLRKTISLTSRIDKIVTGNPKEDIIGLVCLKDIFEEMVEKDFEDHDEHLKSVLSITYLSQPKIKKTIIQDTKFADLEEPQEYTNKTPLIRQNTVA